MKANVFIACSVILLACIPSGMEAYASTKPPSIMKKNMEQPPANTLTEKEKAEGWILLFDGSTTKGWRGYNKTSFPDSGWVVENGTLVCTGRRGGDIVYGKVFGNFHLKLEWKISEGGNSGIFYLGKESEDTPIYMSACEMQVLDNEKHPDAKAGKNGNRTAGSLYDLIPSTPQNVNPVGEWNAVEVIVENGKVSHIVNGVIVVQYDLNSPEFEALVAESKFNAAPAFAKAREGYVGLQDHNNLVWFRNIKIREL